MISRQTRQMLSSMYLAEHRQKYPSIADHCRSPGKFSDKTANDLEKTICWYINAIGGFAERVKNTGRYIQPKYEQNVIGINVCVQKGQFIPGTGRNGTSDISATYRGKSYKIEVKIGRDTQSDGQRAYQERTTRAGGIYMIAKTFDQWLEEFNAINT